MEWYFVYKYQVCTSSWRWYPLVTWVSLFEGPSRLEAISLVDLFLRPNISQKGHYLQRLKLSGNVLDGPQKGCCNTTSTSTSALHVGSGTSLVKKDMVFIVVKLCAKAAIVADTRAGEGEKNNFPKESFLAVRSSASSAFKNKVKLKSYRLCTTIWVNV